MSQAREPDVNPPQALSPTATPPPSVLPRAPHLLNHAPPPAAPCEAAKAPNPGTPEPSAFQVRDAHPLLLLPCLFQGPALEPRRPGGGGGALPPLQLPKTLRNWSAILTLSPQATLPFSVPLRTVCRFQSRCHSPGPDGWGGGGGSSRTLPILLWVLPPPRSPCSLPAGAACQAPPHRRNETWCRSRACN